MARILIIEDDETLQEAYSFAFLKAGYEVDSARRGEDGMALAIKNPPDLILLDMLLLNESGADFLRDLRKREDIGQTKVILFSNLDDPFAIKQASDLGISQYLVKSHTSPKEVVAVVEKELAQ